MHSVGIRDLKAHLSYHLKRVCSGHRVIVTERGRAIAAIEPIDAPRSVEWAHAIVADGGARWNGGKPAGCKPLVAVSAGRAVSDAVLEDRR
jgi:prevent-host-death family protein